MIYENLTYSSQYLSFLTVNKGWVLTYCELNCVKGPKKVLQIYLGEPPFLDPFWAPWIQILYGNISASKRDTDPIKATGGSQNLSYYQN